MGPPRPPAEQRARKGASFACDALEPVRFNSLATAAAPLGAGQAVTFTIAAPVPMGATAPPPGTLISFEVDVVADDGSEVLARPRRRVPLGITEARRNGEKQKFSVTPCLRS